MFCQSVTFWRDNNDNAKCVALHRFYSVVLSEKSYFQQILPKANTNEQDIVQQLYISEISGNIMHSKSNRKYSINETDQFFFKFALRNTIPTIISTGLYSVIGVKQQGENWHYRSQRGISKVVVRSVYWRRGMMQYRCCINEWYVHIGKQGQLSQCMCHMRTRIYFVNRPRFHDIFALWYTNGWFICGMSPHRNHFLMSFIDVLSPYYMTQGLFDMRNVCHSPSNQFCVLLFCQLEKSGCPRKIMIQCIWLCLPFLQQPKFQEILPKPNTDEQVITEIATFAPIKSYYPWSLSVAP